MDADKARKHRRCSQPDHRQGQSGEGVDVYVGLVAYEGGSMVNVDINVIDVSIEAASMVNVVNVGFLALFALSAPPPEEYSVRGGGEAGSSGVAVLWGAAWGAVWSSQRGVASVVLAVCKQTRLTGVVNAASGAGEVRGASLSRRHQRVR